MGDSSFLVQDLHHTTDNSTGDAKANSVSEALGGSVSFGRFLSQSLDWGKWSSFCQKKYLEEVQMYSTPGSVAQKKAYFEAHYRRSSARKSVLFLEQEITEENNIDIEHNTNPSKEETIESAKEANSSEQKCRLGKGVSRMEDRIIIEPSSQIESLELVDDIESRNMAKDMKLGTNSLEKQPLKESSLQNQENKDSIEKRPKAPNLKPRIIERPPRYQSSRSSKLSPFGSKENNPSSNRKTDATESIEKKKSTLRSSHMSIDFSQDRRGATTRTMNKSSLVLKKVEELNVVSSTLESIQDRSNRLITPTRASFSGVLKPPSATPRSEHGRARMPFDQRVSGRAKVDANSYRHSVDSSKSLSVEGNQPQVQTASPSPSHRTVERVEKRNELVHTSRDKFHGKDAKKLQHQESPKEKTDDDMKKLRQSLNFKARPLPGFYHNIEPIKIEIKKVPQAKHLPSSQPLQLHSRATDTHKQRSSAVKN